MYNQIDHLTSSTEKGELRVQNAFASFSGLDPLLYNPFTDPLWQSAVSQFERAIQPAEDKVSGKLRQRFRDFNAGSCQVCCYRYTIISVLSPWGAYFLSNMIEGG